MWSFQLHFLQNCRAAQGWNPSCWRHQPTRYGSEYVEGKGNCWFCCWVRTSKVCASLKMPQIWSRNRWADCGSGCWSEVARCSCIQEGEAESGAWRNPKEICKHHGSMSHGHTTNTMDRCRFPTSAPTRLWFLGSLGVLYVMQAGLVGVAMSMLATFYNSRHQNSTILSDLSWVIGSIAYEEQWIRYIYSLYNVYACLYL